MNEKKETIKEEIKSRGKGKKEGVEKKGSCGECKWYDKSTERDFHRDGIRPGLVEVRAVCRNKDVKTFGHLVHDKSQKPCFEPGVYVNPQTRKEPKKE
jgi:hypothetical protein